MAKQIKRIVSAAAAISLAATASLTVSAKAQSASNVDEIVSALHNSDLQYFNQETMTSYLDYNRTKDAVSPDKDHTIDSSSLPSKADLRNVDGKCYVSPVKLQDPWPTCWSFAAIAAAETSIAYALNHDYNDKNAEDAYMFDLSERHLAWFMYNALPENNKLFPSQAGEGLYSMNDISLLDNQQKSAEVFGTGGFMAPTTTLFSSRIGPVLETEAPYEGKDAELYGKMISIYSLNVKSDGITDNLSMRGLVVNAPMTDEQFNEKIALLEGEGYVYVTMEQLQVLMTTGDPAYADKTIIISMSQLGNGDWTVDESLRFSKAYDLVESNILANPAQTGENGEYLYDANATAMIKNEIVNGKGVTIGLKADQANPGDVLTGDSFINFIDENGQRTTDMENAKIWAQYTYDKSYDPENPEAVNRKVYDMNHAVCIVGYDDNFSKEYFNDPNGTLKGNGAWLAKNSWGSADNDNPSFRKYWGNGGDGYFWISYYDQSLGIPESFSFAVNTEESVATNIDMYDFMPVVNRDRVQFDNDVYMANVFTAKNNCTVRYIGIETVDADTKVEYSVYILNDGAASPTDGHCAATAEITFDNAGYHKVDLGRSLPMTGGCKYSIIAKAVNGDKTSVFFNHSETQEGFVKYYESRKDRWADNGGTGSFKPDMYYSKGVINSGESFVGCGSADNMQWADMADVTTRLKALNEADGTDYFTYDNFPIRSYPETELFSAANVLTEPKDTYAAGNVIKGKLAITNNTEYDFNEAAEIELVLTIGASGKETSTAKVKGLKAGQTLTFDYDYTVTQPDITAGNVVSTLKIKVNGEDYDYNPVFGDTLSFTVKTTYSYVCGDADGDGKITINDVTAIQKNLAQVPQDYFNKKAADIDGKGLDITDATSIQRYLADYGDSNNIGKTIFKDKYELPFIPA